MHDFKDNRGLLWSQEIKANHPRHGMGSDEASAFHPGSGEADRVFKGDHACRCCHRQTEGRIDESRSNYPPGSAFAGTTAGALRPLSR
jgi:hypothetical protein